MADFIKARKIKKDKATDITELQVLGEVAWYFIFAIYEANWDSLPIDKDNTPFRVKALNNFTLKLLNINSGPTSGKNKDKAAKIVKLPPPIPTCLSKEVLEKSKFFGKDKSSISKVNTNTRKSYT